VFLLTVNPVVEMDAVAFPLDICDRFKPVTPEAWIPVNPEPSPINEPVKVEAVTDPEILSNEPYNSINL
jgi:hypothetical protein